MRTPCWGIEGGLTPFVAVIAFCISSCTTIHVPTSQPVFEPHDPQMVASDGVEIRAKLIERRESYLELFDDNLSEIGIAAIWVSVINHRQSSLSAGGIRWELKRGSSTFHPLSNNQLFEQFYRKRGIRMYSDQLDREARRGMSGLLLCDGLLPPSGGCEGFIFCKVPPDWKEGWARDYILTAYIKQEGNRAKETVRIPFSYANP